MATAAVAVAGAGKGRQKTEVSFRQTLCIGQREHNEKARVSPSPRRRHIASLPDEGKRKGVLFSSPRDIAGFSSNGALMGPAEMSALSPPSMPCDCERTPPPGLLNLGKTCSFNVLLQALAATRTFSGLYGGVLRAQAQRGGIKQRGPAADQTRRSDSESPPEEGLVYLHRLARYQRGLLARHRQAGQSPAAVEEGKRGRKGCQEERGSLMDGRHLHARRQGGFGGGEEEDERARTTIPDELAVAMAAERAVTKSDTPLNYCMADILGRMHSSFSGKTCTATAQEEEWWGTSSLSSPSVDCNIHTGAQACTSPPHAGEGRSEGNRGRDTSGSSVFRMADASSSKPSPSLPSSPSSLSSSPSPTLPRETGGEKAKEASARTSAGECGASPAVIIDVEDDDSDAGSRGQDPAQSEKRKRGGGVRSVGRISRTEPSTVIEVEGDAREKHQAVRRQIRLQRQLQTKRWWVRQPEEEQNVLYPFDFVSRMRSLNSDFQQDTELDVEEVWRFLVDQIFTELQQQERRGALDVSGLPSLGSPPPPPLLPLTDAAASPSGDSERKVCSSSEGCCCLSERACGERKEAFSSSSSCCGSESLPSPSGIGRPAGSVLHSQRRGVEMSPEEKKEQEEGELHFLSPTHPPCSARCTRRRSLVDSRSGEVRGGEGVLSLSSESRSGTSPPHVSPPLTPTNAREKQTLLSLSPGDASPPVFPESRSPCECSRTSKGQRASRVTSSAPGTGTRHSLQPQRPDGCGEVLLQHCQKRDSLLMLPSASTLSSVAARPGGSLGCSPTPLPSSASSSPLSSDGSRIGFCGGGEGGGGGRGSRPRVFSPRRGAGTVLRGGGVGYGSRDPRTSNSCSPRSLSVPVLPPPPPFASCPCCCSVVSAQSAARDGGVEKVISIASGGGGGNLSDVRCGPEEKKSMSFVSPRRTNRSGSMPARSLSSDLPGRTLEDTSDSPPDSSVVMRKEDKEEEGGGGEQRSAGHPVDAHQVSPSHEFSSSPAVAVAAPPTASTTAHSRRTVLSTQHGDGFGEELQKGEGSHLCLSASPLPSPPVKKEAEQREEESSAGGCSPLFVSPSSSSAPAAGGVLRGGFCCRQPPVEEEEADPTAPTTPSPASLTSSSAPGVGTGSSSSSSSGSTSSCCDTREIQLRLVSTPREGGKVRCSLHVDVQQMCPSPEKEDLHALSLPSRQLRGADEGAALERLVKQQGATLLLQQLERALVGRLVQVPVPCTCCCRCEASNRDRHTEGGRTAGEEQPNDDSKKSSRKKAKRVGGSQPRLGVVGPGQRGRGCGEDLRESEERDEMISCLEPRTNHSSSSASTRVSASSSSVSVFTSSSPVPPPPLLPHSTGGGGSSTSPDGHARKTSLCPDHGVRSGTFRSTALAAVTPSSGLCHSPPPIRTSSLEEFRLHAAPPSPLFPLSSFSRAVGLASEVFCGVLPLRLPERSRWLSSRTRVNVRGSGGGALGSRGLTSSRGVSRDHIESAEAAASSSGEMFLLRRGRSGGGGVWGSGSVPFSDQNGDVWEGGGGKDRRRRVVGNPYSSSTSGTSSSKSRDNQRQRGSGSAAAHQHSPVTLEECLSLAFDQSSSTLSCCGGEDKRREKKTCSTNRKTERGSGRQKNRSQRRKSGASVVSGKMKGASRQEDEEVEEEEEEDEEMSVVVGGSSHREFLEGRSEEGLVGNGGFTASSRTLCDVGGLKRCEDCGKWRKLPSPPSPRPVTTSAPPPPPLPSSSTPSSAVLLCGDGHELVKCTSGTKARKGSAIVATPNGAEVKEEEEAEGTGGPRAGAVSLTSELNGRERGSEEPDEHLSALQRQVLCDPLSERLVCHCCNQVHVKTFFEKVPDLLVLQLPRSSIIGSRGLCGHGGGSGGVSVKSSIATAASGGGFKIKAHVSFPKNLQELLRPHCLSSSPTFKELCRSFLGFRRENHMVKADEEGRGSLYSASEIVGDAMNDMSRCQTSKRCRRRGRGGKRERETMETPLSTLYRGEKEGCPETDGDRFFEEEVYAPLVSGAVSPSVYTLRAVIEHQGRSGVGGHYVCYRRGAPCFEKKKSVQSSCKLKCSSDGTPETVRKSGACHVSPGRSLHVPESGGGNRKDAALPSSSQSDPSTNVHSQQGSGSGIFGTQSGSRRKPSLTETDGPASSSKLRSRGAATTTSSTRSRRKKEGTSSSPSAASLPPLPLRPSSSVFLSCSGSLEEDDDDGDAADEIWWEVNDAQVTRTTWETVRLCQAYLLVYEREEDAGRPTTIEEDQQVSSLFDEGQLFVSSSVICPNSEEGAEGGCCQDPGRGETGKAGQGFSHDLSTLHKEIGGTEKRKVASIHVEQPAVKMSVVEAEEEEEGVVLDDRQEGEERRESGRFSTVAVADSVDREGKSTGKDGQEVGDDRTRSATGHDDDTSGLSRWIPSREHGTAYLVMGEKEEEDAGGGGGGSVSSLSLSRSLDECQGASTRGDVMASSVTMLSEGTCTGSRTERKQEEEEESAAEACREGRSKRETCPPRAESRDDAAGQKTKDAAGVQTSLSMEVERQPERGSLPALHAATRSGGGEGGEQREEKSEERRGGGLRKAEEVEREDEKNEGAQQERGDEEERKGGARTRSSHSVERRGGKRGRTSAVKESKKAKKISMGDEESKDRSGEVMWDGRLEPADDAEEEQRVKKNEETQDDDEEVVVVIGTTREGEVLSPRAAVAAFPSHSESTPGQRDPLPPRSQGGRGAGEASSRRRSGRFSRGVLSLGGLEQAGASAGCGPAVNRRAASGLKSSSTVRESEEEENGKIEGDEWIQARGDARSGRKSVRTGRHVEDGPKLLKVAAGARIEENRKDVEEFVEDAKRIRTETRGRSNIHDPPARPSGLGSQGGVSVIDLTELRTLPCEGATENGSAVKVNEEVPLRSSSGVRGQSQLSSGMHRVREPEASSRRRTNTQNVRPKRRRSAGDTDRAVSPCVQAQRRRRVLPTVPSSPEHRDQNGRAVLRGAGEGGVDGGKEEDGVESRVQQPRRNDGPSYDERSETPSSVREGGGRGTRRGARDEEGRLKEEAKVVEEERDREEAAVTFPGKSRSSVWPFSLSFSPSSSQERSPVVPVVREGADSSFSSSSSALVEQTEEEEEKVCSGALEKEKKVVPSAAEEERSAVYGKSIESWPRTPVKEGVAFRNPGLDTRSCCSIDMRREEVKRQALGATSTEGDGPVNPSNRKSARACRDAGGLAFPHSGFKLGREDEEEKEEVEGDCGYASLESTSVSHDNHSSIDSSQSRGSSMSRSLHGTLSPTGDRSSGHVGQQDCLLLAPSLRQQEEEESGDRGQGDEDAPALPAEGQQGEATRRTTPRACAPGAPQQVEGEIEGAGGGDDEPRNSSREGRSSSGPSAGAFPNVSPPGSCSTVAAGSPLVSDCPRWRLPRRRGPPRGGWRTMGDERSEKELADVESSPINRAANRHRSSSWGGAGGGQDDGSRVGQKKMAYIAKAPLCFPPSLVVSRGSTSTCAASSPREEGKPGREGERGIITSRGGGGGGGRGVGGPGRRRGGGLCRRKRVLTDRQPRPGSRKQEVIGKNPKRQGGSRNRNRTGRALPGVCKSQESNNGAGRLLTRGTRGSPRVEKEEALSPSNVGQSRLRRRSSPGATAVAGPIAAEGSA